MEVQHEDASAFRCNAWCGRVKIGKKFHVRVFLIDYFVRGNEYVKTMNVSRL